METTPPSRQNVKAEEKIGPYRCLKRIGKGGMGEVFLVYDPLCERNVALKRIRPELQNSERMRNRFLREAKLTSQLTHPGIISIYTIHEQGPQMYYTMPYIEGKTLRQILRTAHLKESAASIPSLLPIFASICQTVSYIHSKGIIHRDLKPENILVGKFGEVIILDWGLAQIMGDTKEEDEGAEETYADVSSLTHPGKIVGTLAYMAPERSTGAPASVQTDIYALGVILYQILTLHLPFDRTSIKDFSRTYHLEKLIDPEEAAPYREVPPRLSRIVKKCLAVDCRERYQSMEFLINDLTSHLEGRSEWFEVARLKIQNKKHWEFQENVLVAKHLAITQTTETADWVSIMLSRDSFGGNTRLHTKVTIGENGAGIGFLLSIPEASAREHPLEGYCLWLGTESIQLFRNTVEVLKIPQIHLKRNEQHEIAIKKVENKIHFILDKVPCFTYLSYLPLWGTHVGILSRDADFEMDEIIVSSGSQNLSVSCLTVPDAFLANKDYKQALAEYRRIGYSFPGQAEGREALFRAGITLLEQAKTARTEKRADIFYTLALDEFAKLHKTPGAPLEYLGKALVYQTLHDHPEEIKCLELGLRRYSKHPLIGALREQIICRMHESSQRDRKSAYQLILIALRLLPDVIREAETQHLFRHTISHWEPIPFLESPIDSTVLGKEQDPIEAKKNKIRFAASLAFWLASPYILQELIQELLTIEPIESSILGDLIYLLFELGSYGLANKFIKNLNDSLLLQPLLIAHQRNLKDACDAFVALSIEDIGVGEFRTISYLMQFALRTDQEEYVHQLVQAIEGIPISQEDQITFDAYQIWAFLKEEKWEKAHKIFEKYPYELLNQESTLLHPLYGCWLYVMEGQEIAQIHFAGVIDTPFPRTWALLGHELTNHITESPAWYNNSFMYERRQLYRQLTLYYSCSENPEFESYYRQLEREEYLYIPE